MKKGNFFVTVLLVGLIIITNHVFSANDYLRASANIQEESLTMITSPDYPPFEFYDTKGDEREIVGFDIDIANTIAKELGFKLKILESDFSGLIPALQSQRADFAMASMSPTPERRQNVDFSIVYYQGKNTIVSLKGSNINNLEQLSGKIIGIQLGTTQEQEAKKIAAKTPNVKLKQLNKVPQIIQEIKSRRIDAGIIADSVAVGFVKSNPELEFYILSPEEVSNSSEGNSSEENGSAIAFPKNSRLVEPFNQVLRKMQEDGTLKEIEKKWFTFPKINNNDSSQQSPKNGINLDFRRIIPDIPFILKGIPLTLLFTLSSLILGLIWGTALSLCKISTIKPIKWLANAYTSIFRGTPLLLQLSLVYYATPQLTGYDITALQAGVLSFTLNSGAYTSETIRGGIQAVDKGQTEAAISMGIPYSMMMKDIILPQALKNILPALVNETIGLLKDSSLVAIIGVVEVLRRAQIVGADKYIYFEPLLFAGLIYYVLVMILTFATSILEKRLRKSE